VAFEGKELKPNHRELMRYLASGYQVQEAAEIVGMTPEQGSAVKNSDLFQREMENMMDRLDEHFVQSEGKKVSLDEQRVRLREKAEDAVDTMVGLMGGADNENVRYRAAEDVLDRAGLKPPEKVEGDFVVQAGENVKAMLESAKRDGVLSSAEDSSSGVEGSG